MSDDAEPDYIDQMGDQEVRTELRSVLSRLQGCEEELATHLKVHLGVVADNQVLRATLFQAQNAAIDLSYRLGAALNLLGRWDAAVDAVTNGHAEFDAFDALSAEGLKMRLDGQSAVVVEIQEKKS